MPHISQLIQNPRLKAADLQDSEWDAVIENIDQRSIGKQMEEEGQTKTCLHFKGWTKFYPCNNTNLQLLAKVFNQDNTDNWIGKAVTLCVNPGVGPQGQDGITFRSRQPDAAAAADAAPPTAATPLSPSVE